jgi:hypothetical protein
MVAAIRQTITVEQDGRLEVRSPQLHSGARAEVIVLLESVHARPPLSLLDDLQQSLRLDPAAARAWAHQVQDERANTARPSRMTAG